MKRIAVLSAALAILLGGCTQFQNAVSFVASPQFTTAATNLKNVAMAFDCGVVVPLAQLSQGIAQIVNAGQSAIGTTGKVYAVSVAVCNTISTMPNATVIDAPSALPAGTKVQSVTVVPVS